MTYITAGQYEQSLDITHPNLVYCRHEHLNQVLRGLTRPSVIVAQCGDWGLATIGNNDIAVDQPDNTKFELEKSPLLVAMFALNNAMTHRPSVYSLPLGVDEIQQEYLRKYEDSHPVRDIFCYANFSNCTHRNRMPVWQAMKTKSFVTFVEKPSVHNVETLRPHQDTFAATLRRCRFVVCPEGNGFDTYRAWETIYSGAYPVVQRSPMTERYAEKLPFVLVDRLQDLTEAELHRAEEEFASRTFDYRTATLSYWKERILHELAKTY